MHVKAKEIFDQVKASGRTLLTEVESKEVLQDIGIPATTTLLAKSKEEAQSLAGKIGYPVVLKIVSPDVVHKSDTGGVKLGLKTPEDVSQAYDEIMSSTKAHNAKANIFGVSVQKMAKSGTEVIVGMYKDAQFGPVLMFGLGGILVEVLKDVSFRIVPLTSRDAKQMIREIKAYPVLEGFRGIEPANLPALEETLLKLSSFVEEHEEVKEMDLNPIFAYKDGAIAVDARIVLES
ncbi:MAG: acetyl-CoA synthetase [Dehalococcoidia bacterium]|nr:acetyl-CoA synthetase [Dehalococcoidia bacterium]